MRSQCFHILQHAASTALVTSTQEAFNAIVRLFSNTFSPIAHICIFFCAFFSSRLSVKPRNKPLQFLTDSSSAHTSTGSYCTTSTQRIEKRERDRDRRCNSQSRTVMYCLFHKSRQLHCNSIACSTMFPPEQHASIF